MATPKTFAGKFPFSSVKQNTESEIVAKNIMVILSRTGDTFRPLSWEDYKEERLKDKNFTECEKGYFNKVIDYFKSEATARLFSNDWKEL
mgnify:CR=1 FL=1|jgi:hypothetical protein